MLSVSEIGQGLVDLCREGKFDEAMAAYYAEGIVSVEGDGSEECSCEDNHRALLPVQRCLHSLKKSLHR